MAAGAVAAVAVAGAGGEAVVGPGADVAVGDAVGDEEDEALLAGLAALLGFATRLMAGPVSTVWKMRGSARAPPMLGR